MLGRQDVGLRGRVVVHDPADGHRVEPLPDVALVETGGGRDLLARRRRQPGQPVEQLGAMTDADHQRQHRVVEQRDHLAGELAGPGLVDRGHRHSASSCRSCPTVLSGGATGPLQREGRNSVTPKLCDTGGLSSETWDCRGLPSSTSRRRVFGRRSTTCCRSDWSSSKPTARSSTDGRRSCGCVDSGTGSGRRTCTASAAATCVHAVHAATGAR